MTSQHPYSINALLSPQKLCRRMDLQRKVSEDIIKTSITSSPYIGTCCVAGNNSQTFKLSNFCDTTLTRTHLVNSSSSCSRSLNSRKQHTSNTKKLKKEKLASKKLTSVTYETTSNFHSCLSDQQCKHPTVHELLHSSFHQKLYLNNQPCNFSTVSLSTPTQHLSIFSPSFSTTNTPSLYTPSFSTPTLTILPFTKPAPTSSDITTTSFTTESPLTSHPTLIKPNSEKCFNFSQLIFK